jgi:hypothetical protein
MPCSLMEAPHSPRGMACCLVPPLHGMLPRASAAQHTTTPSTASVFIGCLACVDWATRGRHKLAAGNQRTYYISEMEFIY